MERGKLMKKIFLLILIYSVFAISVFASGDDGLKVDNAIKLQKTVTKSESSVKATTNASDPKNDFIPMPDSVASSVIKTIYETGKFSIDDQKGYLFQKEINTKNQNLSKYWFGTPIKNINSKFQKLVLYFVPRELRKYGEKFLREFKISFVLRRNTLYISHDFGGKEKEVVFSPRENSRLWIKTPNKSDILLFVPKQTNGEDVSHSFMICQRANETGFYKENTILEDVGYSIDKVSMNVTGGGKASFTTGSLYEGKATVDIITTDVVTPSEMSGDKSIGINPNVEVSYLANKDKVATILDDSNIIGGLKFLFTMQYQSGQKRVSDFTNYLWIKKEDINLPMSFYGKIGDEKARIAIGKGNCYLIVLNAKTLNQVYSQEEFTKNFE